jgi:hypothetical protein
MDRFPLNLSEKNKNRIILVCKIFILTYVIVHDFRFRYFPIRGGLDLSWTYAINYFFNKSIIFGKDVAFTYGPLGFLVSPTNIGNNLIISFVFQMIIWISFDILITIYSLKGYFSIYQLALFAILFAMGRMELSPAFMDNTYPIIYLIMFSMFLSALVNDRFNYLTSIAILLIALLCYIKVNDAISSILFLLSFSILILFVNKGIRFCGITLFTILGILVATYLLYNPSVNELVSYLRESYEIAAGYSVAMSLPGPKIHLLAAAAVVLIYAYALLLLFKSERQSFFLLLSLLPSLFLAFKHGFVRHDGHEVNFFSFALLGFGLMVLFSKMKKSLKYQIPFLAFCLAIICLLVFHKNSPSYRLIIKDASGVKNLEAMYMTLNYQQIKKEFSNNSLKLSQERKLPEDFADIIGNQKVGIFPDEIAYAPANHLNYSPFPIFQAYTAYTSYLDRLNARYLADQDTAPPFLLVHWNAIDGRHPLVDVPAMWLTIYNWYDIAGKSDSLLLLKRRTASRFIHLEPLGNQRCNPGELVNIPYSQGPVIAKIHLELSLKGKLAKIFYKIPEVKMVWVREDGSDISYRTIPDTLIDGPIINIIPSDLKELKMIFVNNVNGIRCNKFKLVGEGIDMYKNDIDMEFYQLETVAK